MQRLQDDNEGGLASRHRIKLTVGAFVVVGLGVYLVTRHDSGPRRPAPTIQTVAIVAPPPPPPPPPPPRPREPRPQPDAPQQMIAQESVPNEAPPPDAPAPSSAPLGTGIKGDGPDSFGLGTTGGNGGMFGGTGNRGGSGGRWGWYASQVQSSIQSALAANPKTRSLSLDARVRIWVGADGGIERVELSGASISAEATAAIKEALTGLPLRQTAPAGMPMPIVLRVSLRRPV